MPKQNGWILVSGHFIEGHWQELDESLWIASIICERLNSGLTSLDSGFLPACLALEYPLLFDHKKWSMPWGFRVLVAAVVVLLISAVQPTQCKTLNPS